MYYQAARILCNSSFTLTIFGVMTSTIQQKWQERSLRFHWMCPNSGIASSKRRNDRDAHKFLAVKLDALLYNVLLLSPSNHYSSSYMYLGQHCLTEMEKIFVLFHLFSLNGENCDVSVVEWHGIRICTTFVASLGRNWRMTHLLFHIYKRWCGGFAWVETPDVNSTDLWWFHRLCKTTHVPSIMESSTKVSMLIKSWWSKG